MADERRLAHRVFLNDVPRKRGGRGGGSRLQRLKGLLADHPSPLTTPYTKGGGGGRRNPETGKALLTGAKLSARLDPRPLGGKSALGPLKSLVRPPPRRTLLGRAMRTQPLVIETLADVVFFSRSLKLLHDVDPTLSKGAFPNYFFLQACRHHCPDVFPHPDLRANDNADCTHHTEPQNAKTINTHPLHCVQFPQNTVFSSITNLITTKTKKKHHV